MKKLLLLFIIITNIQNYLCSKNFILISSPGSGKGTFSQYMAKKYNYAHIGAGDICRWRMDHNLSIEKGTVTKIMKERILKAIEQDQDFILDNAISSESNLQYWMNFFKEQGIADQTYFLILEATDKTCINRIKDRLICRKCFNVTTAKKQSNKCKQCGHTLSIRNGDHNAKFLKKRFRKYHANIDNFIKQIEKPFKLVQISSEQPLDVLYIIYDQLHSH